MDVALFVTCLTDTFFPRVGEAVVRVLRHYGCRVSFPDNQTCCGQPAFNSGFQAEAACLARRLERVFADCDVVVTPSASCATFIKEHAPTLIGGDGVLPGRLWEFCTFLRDRLGVDAGQVVRFTEPVTFHYPCHARQSYTLNDLRGWLGSGDVRTPARPDLCCGFGGMFAVEYPELSGAMLNDKIDQLAATGATLVVSNEAGCTLQMAGGARRRGLPLRFMHLAECLAESLGLLEPES